jgi:hypothetical protein
MFVLPEADVAAKIPKIRLYPLGSKTSCAAVLSESKAA